MFRLLPIVVLWLSIGSLHAVEPKAKVDSKPQWERLLTGDDAKKAEKLGKEITAYQNEDKYAEAIKSAEALLALRKEQQGIDHWQYKTCEADLSALKKIAELSEGKRREWRKALAEDAQGRMLQQKGQFREALAPQQKLLDLRRQILGDEHPHTATSCNNVAFNLRTQGKPVEAVQLSQQALDNNRKVFGEEHPDTATNYNNVASGLQAQAKYLEAAPLYQKALDIRLKVLGEEHADTATSYNLQQPGT